MARLKTFTRMLMMLIFVISASPSVAAITPHHNHPAMDATSAAMPDCHEAAPKSADKDAAKSTGKSSHDTPSEACCDKACTCAVSHCQPPVQIGSATSDRATAPVATTRYDVFSKRLLSAIREQVKPPPKS